MSARRWSSRSGERVAGNGVDRDLDAFVAGTERIDQRPDVLGHETCCGDLHPPRLSRGVLHRAACLLGETEDLAGEGGQPSSAQRQGDPAPIADEQLVAELLAQRRDRNRYGRLGDLELSRRSLHGAEAGDEDKRLKLSESHRVPVRLGKRDDNSDLSDHLGMVGKSTFLAQNCR